MKWVLILCMAGLVVALPFLFRKCGESFVPRTGGAELVVVTPHNEEIRNEFGAAFSKWHERRYGVPVRVDWRVIGGTTEIMRYLDSEFQASASAYCRDQARQGKTVSPEEAMRFDSPQAVSCRMDVFFGGGVYDHAKAERKRLTVPAWPEGKYPDGLFTDADGHVLIPESVNGEIWRGKAFYGTVLSAFGICCNTDRLRDLGITEKPKRWEDLADPRYCGFIGLADPTKSGSVAKAFELIVHSQCAKAVARAGFSRAQVNTFEAQLAKAGKKGAPQDAGIPEAYGEAVSRGWMEGVQLLRRLGANTRYFTASSGKVPVDVSMGAVAAGIAIDFFGRLQTEQSVLPDGRAVMEYVTPVGESSITADPVSLLRGAPHRLLAERFIAFVLSEDGQKLWCLRPGTPGGPERKALRRLPIRKTFYPSDDPAGNAFYEANKAYYADPIGEPGTDAYRLGGEFVYVPRWTDRHFALLRDLVRAMCMDSGDELREAWRTILRHGGAEKNPRAMAFFNAMPQSPIPLTRESALSMYGPMPRQERLAGWTAFFREQYRLARQAAEQEENRR